MATALPKISAPAQRALASVGVDSLEQLADLTEAEVKALHGMGPNALGKLKTAMETHRLAFRPAR